MDIKLIEVMDIETSISAIKKIGKIRRIDRK